MYVQDSFPVHIGLARIQIRQLQAPAGVVPVKSADGGMHDG